MKFFRCNTNTCNVFASFYFLFIDQANHAIVSLHLLKYSNRPRIAARSVKVKAPTTLQEKSLIVYALNFIKVFTAEVLQRFNAQKYDCKSCVAL